MFSSTNSFPFAVGGQFQSVTDLHPSGVQIFQLWQIYLDNVNPLLKLTHTPTLQVQIIEASTNLTNVSKSLEVLMFAIYLMAITSLNDNEVQQTFNETKPNLLAKYQHGTQQALFNVGFMRMPDLTVLQAYLLYCVSSPPRCLVFLLILISFRLASGRRRTPDPCSV